MASVLPSRYQILPYTIPHAIPAFPSAVDEHVLAPEPTTCAAWYGEFVEALVAAKGKKFVPVGRMSDGEFLFALGRQPPDVRRPWHRRLFSYAAYGVYALKHRGGLQAGAPGYYHSGTYSRREWQVLKEKFGHDMGALSREGYLALHLSYGAQPFQEYYFPALGTWLRKFGITLTTRNYVPFYFVYAALCGPDAQRLLNGRILVVNSATGDKQARTIRGLRAAGATEVLWCPISARRAVLDTIDVRDYVGKVDLVLLGAGLGKANVLRQLKELRVPCIDAGFMFEVWADARRASHRAYCSCAAPTQTSQMAGSLGTAMPTP